MVVNLSWPSCCNQPPNQPNQATWCQTFMMIGSAKISKADAANLKASSFEVIFVHRVGLKGCPCACCMAGSGIRLSTLFPFDGEPSEFQWNPRDDDSLRVDFTNITGVPVRFFRENNSSVLYVRTLAIRLATSQTELQCIMIFFYQCWEGA